MLSSAKRDGVDEHQEILVARYSGQAAADPFLVAAAVVTGRRRQALGVCLRNLGSGAPSFFGRLSQVAESPLGVGLL